MITAQKLHQADKCSPSPRPFSALRSSAVLTEESPGRTKVRDIHIDCRSSSVTDAGCFFLKHLHIKWNFLCIDKTRIFSLFIYKIFSCHPSTGT